MLSEGVLNSYNIWFLCNVLHTGRAPQSASNIITPGYWPLILSLNHLSSLGSLQPVQQISATKLNQSQEPSLPSTSTNLSLGGEKQIHVQSSVLLRDTSVITGTQTHTLLIKNTKARVQCSNCLATTPHTHPLCQSHL